MSTQIRLNESLVAILGDLASMKTENPFKQRAYSAAQESVLEIQEDITDINQLKGVPRIGSSIFELLAEFVNTGKIAKLEKYRAHPISIFSEIYGVGPKKAEELVKLGIPSIAKLRQMVKQNPGILNGTQKVGLQYYEDILERIPRQEIDEYKSEFERIVGGPAALGRPMTKSGPAVIGPLSALGRLTALEIVGSYRRGSLFSGDIDVIFTSPSSTEFDHFLDSLISANIIVEVLSRGKSKCLVIACLPSHRGRRQGFIYRRVDFLYATRTEFPFSILYFTGSKGFNVVMRNHAISLGYSMNEHGLTQISTGQLVNPEQFESEQDIFHFLGLEYKRPEERIDGRSVQKLVAKPEAKVEPKLEPKLEPKVVAKEPSPKEPSPKEPPSEKLIKTSPQKSPKTKKARPNMKPRAPRTKKNVSSSVEELIQSFAQHGISVLESLSESQLSAMIRKANDVYYNASSVSSSSSDPLLTDAQYDIIKEYIERKFPANTAIKEVGAKIVKNKVVLPYEMASMDKIKPESGALSAWTAKYKGPYILSAKLDGVSGLYTCEGGTPQLYTRGDGKVGQDVSHLTRVLSLPCIPGLVVRGEFILRKAVFETKYKGTFATARNLVAGIVNAKTIDDKTRDLDFVVYEVIKPAVKPSKQMETLLSHGFKTVWHTTSKTLSNEMLSDVLQDTRAKYEYETDGIIVANDAVYPRSTGNPEHAFAFKMVIGDQMAEAKVVDVLWEVSQDGYFKPRIRIEPVNIAGVNIEYTTGFNGKFIEENGIGVGAIVRIIRSGDVIPYIREVIAPAKAKMPEVPYVWTATRVDIMVENAAEDPAVKRKNVVGFFLELDIKGLGESNLKKIVEAGHDSVAKILALPLATLEKVFGKGKTASALFEGIRARMESVTLGELMTASNMFGRGIGRKSVDALLEAHPDFLTSAENKVYKLEVLAKVGVKKNGEQFYDAIVPFVRFLEECGLSGKLLVSVKEPEMKESAIDSPLYNKSVVMTKVRDAEIIDFLKRVGATLDDAMKTTTFVLIVKDRGDVSSKTKYAEARGIPIMTVEEFKGQYL